MQFMHRCFSQPASELLHNNPALKPFSNAEWKGMEECYMALYRTACYRLEWKSRSSASRGAVEPHLFALQRRMVSALWMYSQCMLTVLFVLTASIDAFMWPECLMYTVYFTTLYLKLPTSISKLVFKKKKKNQCSTLSRVLSVRQLKTQRKWH